MRANALLPLLLKTLRLNSMKQHWEQLASKAVREGWAPEEYLLNLCQLELDNREDKRLQRYLKEARLPVGKCLEEYDFSAIKGVSHMQVNQLATEHDWVKTGDNILLFGASGLGKTHLASAIGYKLVEAGHRVKFTSASALMQELQQSKLALTLAEHLIKLDKYSVLIVDDIGYVQKNTQETSVLFELIAHRYERHSLIITSNKSFEEWDKLFDDTAMTVAAIDRLIHHAKILHCEGESYRRRQVLQRD